MILIITKKIQNLYNKYPLCSNVVQLQVLQGFSFAIIVIHDVEQSCVNVDVFLFPGRMLLAGQVSGNIYVWHCLLFHENLYERPKLKWWPFIHHFQCAVISFHLVVRPALMGDIIMPLPPSINGEDYPAAQPRLFKVISYRDHHYQGMELLLLPKHWWYRAPGRMATP